MGPSTFRLMDPVSQRMVGLRADMTLQIARIAATRLRRLPRRLRLSYAGQVLRVKGDEIRPERQVGQVGAELIGAQSAAADVEAVLLAAQALEAGGHPHITGDPSPPPLPPPGVPAAAPQEAAAPAPRATPAPQRHAAGNR